MVKEFRKLVNTWQVIGSDVDKIKTKTKITRSRSTVMVFQEQNRETINSTWKVAVSFKIIMTTSVTRPCFTTRHQTCKTMTTACKTKIKTDFLVLHWSCPKTDRLRPNHLSVRVRWPAFLTHGVQCVRCASSHVNIASSSSSSSSSQPPLSPSTTGSIHFWVMTTSSRTFCWYTIYVRRWPDVTV